MPSYAILLNPGHNRVYFKTARNLALLELEYAGRKLSKLPINPREEILGGIPYILFGLESQLIYEDMLILSRLSFTYGIFEWNGLSLLPLEKNPQYYFGSDDITSILKYNGKTNELFTRMMLNIAIFCSSFLISDRLSILDPLCGKGTSLFEGLLCSYNVFGLDIDGKMISEASGFFKKYLENARYKHSFHQERQGMKDYTAWRYQFSLSRDKADKSPAEAEFITGDTRDIAQFFRKNTFGIIIGDLPYGVQHGSKAGKKESRNSLPMLKEALPGWHKVLKSGGTLALAWNLFLIGRQEIEEALEEAGFILCMPKQDTSFVHRVDQAINRDLIVGVKP